MSAVVYTAEGRAVRVLATLPDARVIVEIAREDGDGEMYFSDEALIVDRVFANPPLEAFHRDIVKLEERQKLLRDSISALRTEGFNIESTHKERISKLKKFEQLKFIEEFLDGKLTHYVIVQRYSEACIRISTPAEEIDTEGRWNKKQKLLVLFGNPRDYSLQWYLSDESRAYPFTSLDDARAKAAELLADAFKLVRTQPYHAERAIESATVLNMPVPDDILQMVREQRRKSAQQSVDEARKTLAEAERAFAVATGGAS
jgi:hypothetical protein